MDVGWVGKGRKELICSLRLVQWRLGESQCPSCHRCQERKAETLKGSSSNAPATIVVGSGVRTINFPRGAWCCYRSRVAEKELAAVSQK